jgi:uncharacterized protein YndB with AHSA1/START domain
MAGSNAADSRPDAPTAAGRELVLTRTFDAPRGLVFRAWTDPSQLARWWGPRGFTNPVCEIDPKSGGALRIDMKGPDGTVYPMKGVYREVVEPERIVFSSTAMEDEDGRPAFEILNTVTFDERDGRTTLTLRAVVVVLAASPEAAAAVAGMEEGWSQSLDRLAAELSATAVVDDPDGAEFVITRVFDAPRDLVFRAWTDPGRLAHWFGPRGFTTASTALDLRPGGVFHHSMTSPDGRVMWGRWVFRDIDPPGRLVFVASFSDESGGIARSPFSADWPLEVLSALTFTEHEGRTTLTMRGVPLDAIESERRAFEAGHGSMQKGWAGTLDQLDAFLAGG